MSSDLDLRELHRTYEPDPEFVARLRARLEAGATDSPDAESVTEVDIEPVTPAARLSRHRWLLRAAAAVVVIAGIVAAVSIAGDDDSVRTGTDTDPTPTPVIDEPLAAFIGGWSSVDGDDSTLMMTIVDAGDGTAEITVLDDGASVCAGAPSTMTGTGEMTSTGDLVIAAPELTCDDGTAPEALSGPPLEDQLRDLTFTPDGDDTLTDSLGGRWRRVGADDDPTVEGSGEPLSGGMWPQTTLEEVRAAQELADAGDPAYTWQIDEVLADGPGTLEQGARSGLVDRFLRDELGWSGYFLLDVGLGSADGSYSAYSSQRYLRCAADRTNPLYPPGPDPDPAELCAPTLDDQRYESVSLDLVQLGREAPDGLWVVNRWELTAPFVQADPAVVEEQGRRHLEEFLVARVAGQGAEEYVQADTDIGVPLLYATTSGTPYERYEIERLGRPLWPEGGLMFSVRMFTTGDEILVEQAFFWTGEALWPSGVATIENGEAVVVSHTSSDGEVSISALGTWDTWSGGGTTHPLAPGVWFWEFFRGEDRIEFTDPVAYDEWCAANGGSPLLSAPADAAAIAMEVIADPDFEATAPVAARVGGLEAVSIDVALAPGGAACGVGMTDISRWIHTIGWDPTLRMRLYLVDLPDGMPVPTLAITIVAPEERFDDVIAETAPIIESIEFHRG